MRNIKQHWLLVLTAVTLLWFCLSVSRAQDAAANTSTNDSTAAMADTNAASTAPAAPDAETVRRDKENKEDVGKVNRNDVVQIGHDAELKADEVAEDVVSVFGSAKVLGHAHGNVVAVFGNVDLQGKADGQVVAVFGTLHAGSNAVVGSDAVAVGGIVDREPGAKFYGQVQESAINFPGLRDMGWLSLWFAECAAKFRLLAPQVPWVWAVAGVFFLVYLLIAAAFPNAVRPCVEALNTRPVTSLAVGLIGKFVVPIVYLLLAVTVVGIFVIPFIQVAMIVAFLVGKVAILERIGGGVGKATGVNALQRPIIGFVLGAVIITIIYTIPVLSVLTFLFVSSWGSGAAVTAAYLRMRGERRSKPPGTPMSPITPTPAPTPTYTMAVNVPGATMTTATAGPASAANPTDASIPEAPPISAEGVSSTSGFVPPIPPNPGAPPFAGAPSMATVPMILAYPRGNFWMRIAAGALDCFLVFLLIAIARPPFGFFVFTAIGYFTCMLAWKGTTVGGIILRLQVVRSNGQPLSFMVALVRSLAAVFSCFCLFLGFFWIGWDSEKQGWHDKIAGTVVVRLPHAPSLICF